MRLDSILTPPAGKKGLFAVLGLAAILAAVLWGPRLLSKEETAPDQGGGEISLTEAERVGKQLSHGVCEGAEKPKLSTSPMDLKDFVYIIPYGLVVGGHVTPIDHQYFEPVDRNSPRDAYGVYAMADADIVDIKARSDSSEEEEYRLVFSVSCTLFYYYDLVTSLAPDIEAAYEEFRSGQGDLKISVEEGQLIGRIGGQTLDFAVWDTEITLLGFIVPEHYEAEPWKTHTVDPLNYYTDKLKETLLARYIRTVEPVSGKIDHDIDGRLIGNWFLEGSGGYGGGGNEPYWRGHLAIIPDHIDPTAFIASFGDFSGEADQFTLEKESSSPAEVSVETGLVKYELVDHQYIKGNGEIWDGKSLAGNLERRPTTHSHGCVLFQLMENRTLKMQTFPGEACSQISEFTNAAIYER
jgi:hypothetical protein